MFELGEVAGVFQVLFVFYLFLYFVVLLPLFWILKRLFFKMYV